jgi:hypothetical protein
MGRRVIDTAAFGGRLYSTTGDLKEVEDIRDGGVLLAETVRRMRLRFNTLAGLGVTGGWLVGTMAFALGHNGLIIKDNAGPSWARTGGERYGFSPAPVGRVLPVGYLALGDARATADFSDAVYALRETRGVTVNSALVLADYSESAASDAARQLGVRLHSVYSLHPSEDRLIFNGEMPA